MQTNESDTKQAAGHHDGRRAVVLGGSIAGLLAGRVLADHVRTVTIVDRDELTTSVGPRRGVPQGRHIHALLAGGQHALEELLPGLTDELRAAGAPVGDMLADADVVFGGHRLCRTTSGLPLVGASRPLVESVVRRRVMALGNVDATPPADVVGLRARSGRIDGAHVVRRAAGSTGEVIDGDLVVDATGRSSAAPTWLEELGVGAPTTDQVAVGIGYATRRYRLPEPAVTGTLAYVVGPTPERPRGGVLARLEDDVWMATLYGYDGDHPPLDATGFDAFAASLEPDDIARVLRQAVPIDEAVRHRFAANVRRRYERLDDLPEGFVAVGDALSSFNPVYGQGMAVAALQAVAMRRQLLQNGALRTRPIVRALAGVVRAPWELATGADLTLPVVDGPRDRRHAIVARWVGRVQSAGRTDPAVARAFVRVTGLVDRPEALMRPTTVARVLAARRP